MAYETLRQARPMQTGDASRRKGSKAPPEFPLSAAYSEIGLLPRNSDFGTEQPLRGRLQFLPESAFQPATVFHPSGRPPPADSFPICAKSPQISSKSRLRRQTACKGLAHCRAMAKLILLPTPKPRLPSKLLNDAWWLVDEPRPAGVVVAFPCGSNDREGEQPVLVPLDNRSPHVRN